MAFGDSSRQKVKKYWKEVCIGIELIIILALVINSPTKTNGENEKDNLTYVKNIRTNHFCVGKRHIK